MNIDDFFAQSFAEARAKFLAAAKTTDGELWSIRHPQTGIDGEELAVDVLSLGDPMAKNVLIVCSAVHGVEGYYGSGAINAALNRGIKLRSDTRVVLIHGINPWGMSFGRRFNENNVDLNRNYLLGEDRSAVNKGYEKIQGWAEIKGLEDSDLAAACACGERLEADIGLTEMKILLSKGQTSSPKGLFFAGYGTCWSTLALHNIMRRVLYGAEQAIFMDLHTGLGPIGFADILSGYAPNSQEINLLGTYIGKAAFGEHRAKATGSTPHGTLTYAINELFADIGIRGLHTSIECGTQDLDIVLDALRLETALHFHADKDHPKYDEIKRGLRDAFYVDTPEWKQSVVEQTLGYIEGAINCLANEALPTRSQYGR